MFGLGIPELVVIFLAILFLFGAKALPEIARGFGRAVKYFKKEANEITSAVNESVMDEDKKDHKTPTS